MKILITGTSSGLGAALVKTLEQQHTIIAVDIHHTPYTGYDVDVRSWDSVKALFHELLEVEELPDCIINNAGINYIDWIENTPPHKWHDVMNTNATSIYNVANIFAKHLCQVCGTMVNITANAAWVPMTNSIAYNASKGAAHIMTLQIARELSPKGVTVFGVAPNRLKGTGMSNYIDDAVCGLRGWSKEQAEAHQLAALPAGAETPPESVAEFIAYLLQDKEHHRYLTGAIIPYGK